MDSSLIVADFTSRLSRGIKAFAGSPAIAQGPALPSRDDAADIREFVRPLTGKRGAALGIKHARLRVTDGERETVAEYIFDENELNRAAVNIDEALTHDMLRLGDAQLQEADAAPAMPGSAIMKQVMLFFEQASRKPGKERGRTADRAIVPEVSDKALPVHFRQSFENLKDKMVRGDVNPLTCTFVVDVHVQNVGGEPKGYIVTDVHKIIPPEDEP